LLQSIVLGKPAPFDTACGLLRMLALVLDNWQVISADVY